MCKRLQRLFFVGFSVPICNFGFKVPVRVVHLCNLGVLCCSSSVNREYELQLRGFTNVKSFLEILWMIQLERRKFFILATHSVSFCLRLLCQVEGFKTNLIYFDSYQATCLGKFVTVHSYHFLKM
ncbi:hypothetical protein LOK49_LG14G00823 [Camellia lanceoleosa]|uniref:Uncharacterized protein n=1 Tax=Camellia lanceoleosa TaxID=1840588 RepID=A0ACC0FAI0_9ERIC|nr:hypothetical protein LOK49_LG14G00823 [Camellia lanceoleosa]